jgi:transposase
MQNRRLARLSDQQWERIQGILPGAGKKGGRPAKPHRPMVEAMIWILRTGAPWRDLPRAYGAWQSVYSRFSRWSASGILAALFEALAREKDSEGYLIDATIVRAHQDASGASREGPQQIGRSRGGPSTKIHALVDALGNPVRRMLSPGQAHEMKFAFELLKDICDAYVVGDSAYSSQALVKELEARRCNAVLAANPTHAPRDFDRHLYRERFQVENFFQRIKRFRRIAMRFEKLARNYLAFLHLACALVWLV